MPNTIDQFDLNGENLRPRKLFRLKMNTITDFIFLISLYSKLIYCQRPRNYPIHYRVDTSDKTRHSPDAKLSDSELQELLNRHVGEGISYDFVRVFNRIDPVTNVNRVHFETEDRDWVLNLKQQNKQESVVSDKTQILKVFSNGKNSYIYKNKIFADERFDSRNIYEDEDQMATILYHKRGSILYYDGIIGEGASMRVIRSAPVDVIKEFGSGWHFLVRVHNIPNANLSTNRLELPNDSDTGIGLKVLYPKLVVVVDYSLFSLLGKHALASVKFLTIFWNAVDLKYRKFTNPKVNIQITGIILAEDANALEYISNNMINDHEVDGRRMLEESKNYFSQNFVTQTDIANYDAVFTMIGLNEKSKLAGGTYVGTICAKYQNVAFIQEEGGFYGTLIAAHKLGHLLDIGHDIEMDCPEKIGNATTLMAKIIDFSDTKFVWSTCSHHSLLNFAKSDTAKKCLGKKQRNRKIDLL